MDLAGEQFWNGFWRNQHGRRFAGVSHFHRCLVKVFTTYVTPGTAFCEMGCGGATWMPLLVERGAEVWGIDYSEQGIALARANLAKAGVTATLIQGDVLAPGALPPAAFDVIFSAGLIEHFDDPSSVLEIFGRALRPNGVIITLVPNLVGWWGDLQRRVDPHLFSLHRAYRCDELDGVHGAAGLAPIEAGHFFGGFGPLVVNYSRWLAQWPPFMATVAVRALWAAEQLVAWSLTALRIRDRKSYSSHILGVYSKRAAIEVNGHPPQENASS